jgi:threonyl-tRNA synthetase
MQNKDEKLLAMRHSTEHVLTQTMLKLYPGLKMAMGPATDEGFYFDFDYSKKISEEDFPKIESEMKDIIKRNLPFKKRVLEIAEARKLFKNNEYKQEWLDEIKEKGEKATVYWTGDEFVDLCAGPHVKSTGDIGPFKLLSIAGAYWRGDEKNKMLTRIYGTAFPTKKELDEYLKMQEEAKKRDHRKLGKTFDLFSFSPLVGSGLPLYSPKGALLRSLVNEHVESIQSKEGYQQVWTPQIAKAELFKISGHYDKYRENMFKVLSNYSEEEFYLKPMNCPQHTQIYAARPRSYKELPFRITDFAMLYRDEKPGELVGLARTRSFSQDDCHVFCREDQVNNEVDTMLSMTKKIMKVYGFKYRYRLSTMDKSRPKDYLGDPKTWNKVENWAVEIMKRNKIDYYDAPGEAAFYAPKMDLMATDSLGREWQLSTVQIDYFMPDCFKLKYTDKDGGEKTPIMLHRAIIGSPERFLMILLEHFAGAFPVWLSPVQAKVLPITERNLKYATGVMKKLRDEEIRVELDGQNETLQAKIRDAQLKKVPYMLVVGEREEKSKKVAVRLRTEKDLGQMSLEKFIKRVNEKVESKSLTI